MDDDDTPPTLSTHALAALQEFYAEQSQSQENEEIEEDWNLSQFWYDDQTAEIIAKEAIGVAGPNGSIACVSCPTLYKKIAELKPDSCKVVILEYDKRFNCYNSDFVFYDYNNPLELPNNLSKAFDLVLVDPPFLSDECLTKVAITVRYIAKEKILLNTGAVMQEMVEKLLGLKPCAFKPKHTRNLANDFHCYINYNSQNLQKER